MNVKALVFSHTRKRNTYSLCLLLAISSLPSYEAVPELSKKDKAISIVNEKMSGKIRSIKITGNTKVESDAIISALVSKVGENYSEVKTSEDILEIYKMGFFEDILVYKDILEDGSISLVYAVVEIRTIFQVKVVGNELITEKEIEKIFVGIEKYQPANLSSIKETQEKIKQLYADKGYFLAQVEFRLDKTSSEDQLLRLNKGVGYESTANAPEIDTTNVYVSDYVDVVFTIKENDKIKVERVSISGNKILTDDEIKDVLRTKEEHILGIVSDWGNFRQDFVEIDKLILEKIFADKGFLKAKVLEPVIELSLERASVSIQYRIEEGPQYSLGEIEIEGDLIETSDIIYDLRKENEPQTVVFLSSKLENLITLKSNEIFNRTQMGQDVQAIAAKYKDSGYAYVNVAPHPSIDEENLLINFIIKIESGPRVFIERFEIIGNTKTQDEVIRRELKLNEGDYYSSSLLQNSEQNINRLGYFESVSFSESAGSTPEKMLITVEVKEKKNTGSVQIGGAYSSSEGIMFKGQIGEQNLFGRGQILSASVNWSANRQMFDLSFMDPYAFYVFEKPITTAFTAYSREITFEDFFRKTTGGDITLGFPIGRFFNKYSDKWFKKASPAFRPYVLDFDALSFYLTYTAERSLINDLDSQTLYRNFFHDVPFYTTSLKPSFRLDQRNNRLLPSKGYYFDFSMEFASKHLGSHSLAVLENKIVKNKKTSDMNDGLNYLKHEARTSNFVRYITNLRLYHSLDDWFFMNGIVAKTNFDMGFINDFGKPVVSENFYLGGMNSLRGYAPRSISPAKRLGGISPFGAKKLIKVGGNKQVSGSFELEFPIIKLLGLNGVFFFDYGNVFSNEENLFYMGKKNKQNGEIKPHDPLHIYEMTGLYSSAGIGLRWQAPMLGMMRFEWGFPLTKRKPGTSSLLGDDPVAFELGMGASF